MASIVDILISENLINPPRYVKNNICYEVITGSTAYGCNESTKSDFDIYSVCIPMKEIIFPHLGGHIPGFGRSEPPNFNKGYVKHHIDYKGQKEYDVTIKSIVKYFQLCMENNPDTLDTMFVPQDCITAITPVGQMIRDNRKMFLHKGAYHKFRGYAFAQLGKMAGHKREGKRKEVHEKYGFDLKFAMHLCRLLEECEQILLFGDLDLRKGKEYLKAIRRGEVSEAEIRAWASEKEKYLDKLYHESKLQHQPDELAIRQLLLSCLEQHFGSLDKAVLNQDKYSIAISQISEIIARMGNV